jgi:mono/diheme cytochrome c family protein
VALGLIAFYGVGSGSADDRRGEWFAGKWCSACHAVAPNQASPRPSAPAFSDVAADPSVNEASLRIFLRSTPHQSMPKFKLTPKDTDDVIGYILSLRRR